MHCGINNNKEKSTLSKNKIILPEPNRHKIRTISNKDVLYLTVFYCILLYIKEFSKSPKIIIIAKHLYCNLISSFSSPL